MSINEEAWAQDYLIDYLSADATLSGLVNGVWTQSVPEKEPMPVVKLDVLSRSDLMAIGLIRVWADLTVHVRGIVHWNGSGHPDWTEARAIGDRIDTLLHDHEDATSVLQVHSFREEPRLDETIEGSELFLHCGGIYRLRAHAV